MKTLKPSIIELTDNFSIESNSKNLSISHEIKNDELKLKSLNVEPFDKLQVWTNKLFVSDWNFLNLYNSSIDWEPKNEFKIKDVSTM